MYNWWRIEWEKSFSVISLSSKLSMNEIKTKIYDNLRKEWFFKKLPYFSMFLNYELENDISFKKIKKYCSYVEFPKKEREYINELIFKKCARKDIFYLLDFCTDEMIDEYFIDLKWENTGLCEGCALDLPGQKDHMGVNGCLS